MAAFVELTPDPFNTSFQSATTEQKGGTGANRSRQSRLQRGLFSHVRRPVRGLQIKDDTFATIQVISSDGVPKLLIDAGGRDGLLGEEDEVGRTAKYSNFLLQNVTEARQEKTQIVETFGEPYIFFYGERPRVVQFNGILINSEDFNWRAEWWENYDLYLRGTKCAQNKTRVLMSWDDIVVQGYMMNCTAQEQATEPLQVPFSFSLFLTHYENISRIGETEFPRSADEVSLDPNTIDVEGFSSAFKSSTQQVRALNEGKGKNSLLARIRNGLQNAFTIADSYLNGSIDLTTDFVSGRVVRVPIGFAGGAVFDDVQIALGSVDLNTFFNQGIQGKLGSRTVTIKAPALAQTFQQAKYGKISENVDEFIARVAQTAAKSSSPPDLFADQLTSDGDVTDKVRQVFKKFGIKTDPPNDLLRKALGVGFGLAAVGAGVGILAAKGASSANSSVNQAGSVVLGVL